MQKLPRLCDVLTDLSLREASQQDCDLRGAAAETKLELARLSAAAGVRTIEVTAFAPGAWFADAPALAAGLPALPNVTWRALYFNVRGLEDMLKFPCFKREGVFNTAVSANYREKNYRQGDQAAVLEKLKEFVAAFLRHGLEFDTLLLSTAWGEPGERVEPAQCVAFTRALLETAALEGLPVHSLTVCDTVGNASPEEVGRLFTELAGAWPKVTLRAHLHPPAALARASIESALDAGVRHWEAAWGGMGGSPLADVPGGNLDIRALMAVWKARGAEHGLDEARVKDLIDFLRANVKRKID